MGAYEPLVGFLNSQNLRWSFASMQGHDLDLGYRAPPQKPLEMRVAAIKKIGFAGICVNPMAMLTNGIAAVRELSRLTDGPPILKRANGPSVSFC